MLESIMKKDPGDSKRLAVTLSSVIHTRRMTMKIKKCPGLERKV